MTSRRVLHEYARSIHKTKLGAAGQGAEGHVIFVFIPGRPCSGGPAFSSWDHRSVTKALARQSIRRKFKSVLHASSLPLLFSSLSLLVEIAALVDVAPCCLKSSAWVYPGHSVLQNGKREPTSNSMDVHDRAAGLVMYEYMQVFAVMYKYTWWCVHRSPVYFLFV